MKHKNRFILLGLITVMLFALAGISAQAATFTSQAAGKWSNKTTWLDQDGVQGVPTSSDDVVIGGHIVTIDGDFACKSLLLNAAASKLMPEAVGEYTLSVSGDITFTGAAEINYRNSTSNNGRLNLNITGTSTLTTTAAATSGTDGLNVNNLTITGTVTQIGAFGINIYGNLAVNAAGKFVPTAAAGGLVTMLGNNTKIINSSTATNALVFYDLTIGDGATAINVTTSSNFEVANTMTMTAGVVHTFTASAGTIIFSGAAVDLATSTSSTTLYNVIAKGGASTTTGNYTIAGDFTNTIGNFTPAVASTVTFSGTNKAITVTAGTVTFGLVNVTGAYTLDGDFVVNGAGATALNISATGSLNATSGTVNITGAGGITNLGTASLYNLVFNNAGATTLSGTVTVKNNLTNTLGAMTGGTIIMTGGTSGTPVAITITAGTLQPSVVTLAAGSYVQPGNAWVMSATQTLNVYGTLKSAVAISGAAGAAARVYSGATIYVSGALTTGVDAGAATSVFNTTAMTLAFPDGASTVNLEYDAAITLFGTALATCNNLTFNAATGTIADDITVSGNVTDASAGAITFNAANGITMSGSGKHIYQTNSGGNFFIGILTINGTVTTDANFSIIGTTAGATLVIGAAGSLEATAGTITFDAATGGISNGAAATALKFYNLTCNTGDFTTASNFYVKGSITSDGTATLTASAGTINMTGEATGAAITGPDATTELIFYNLNVSGTVTPDAFIDIAAGGSITVTSTGSFSQTVAASTVNFIGAGTITNSGTLQFYDLLVPAATTVSTTSSFSVLSSLNVAVAGGLFSATAGTITLKGATLLTPPAANDRIVFNNLLIASGSTVTTAAVAQSITVAGNLQVAATGSFIPDATTTVKMTGVNKEIINNGVLTFGLLNIAANAKTTTANDFTIAGGVGALTLAASTSSLIANDGTITMSAAASTIVTTNGTLVFNNLSSASTAATAGVYAINGNLSGAVTTVSSGLITFSGEKNQTISVTANAANFGGGIVVNKASGDLILSSSIGVTAGTGNITLTKGDIDLNGNNITISASNLVTLVEGNGYKVKNTSATNSFMQATAAAGAVTANVGGLGFTFTTDGNAHVIKRYHSAPSIASKTSINRYYSIQSAVAAIPVAGTSFAYNESELPGGNESNLVLYRMDAPAATYSLETYQSAVNTASNTISGIASAATISLGTTDLFTFVVNSGVAYTSQTGNWSDVDTWETGSIPTASDMVVIKDGHTVSVDQDPTVSGLIIEGAGVLQPALTGTYTLSNSGELTFKAATSRLKAQNASGLLSLNMTGGTSASPKMIRLLDNDNFKVNNLTLEGYFSQSGDYTVEVVGSLALNGISDLYLTTGKFNFNGAGAQTISKSDASTLRFNDIQIGNGSVTTITKDFAITGDVTNGLGSFTQTTGTTTFDGGATQTIIDASNGNFKLNDVVITGKTPVATASTIGISGNFTLDSNCTFSQSAGSVIFTNSGWKTITNNARNSNTDLVFGGIIVTDGSKVTTSTAFDMLNAATLEVKGTGKFVAEDGLVNFAGAGTITNSKTGTLEFYNLAYNGAISTTADMTIKGSLDAVASTFTASSPSTITFKNKDLGTTTVGQLLDPVGNLTFYNLVVADESKVTTADNIFIEKDMTVLGNGVFAQSANTTQFQGARAKTLTNNGSVSFFNLTIADVGSNVLSTSSSFTVANNLIVGSSSSTGALKASGSSVISINGTGAAIAQTGTDEKTLEFQNLILGGSSAVTPAATRNFTIKGDFTDNAGFNPATIQTVYFKGNAQQKISGTGTTIFDNVVLDNTLGILLEKNIEVNGTNLTLTAGDIDLNGNNIINMSNAAPVFTEASGYTVKNTVAGTGYLTISASSTEAVTETANTGILFEAGNPSAITLKRFHNELNVNGTESVSRYYQLNFTGTPTGLTMKYDNTELDNDGASSYLSFFKTSTANAATTSAWTGLGGTANPGTGTGSVTEASGMSITTGDYITVAPQGVSVTAFPAYGIETRNQLSVSPLVASASSQIVLGFALTANGSTNFTQMYAHFNVTPENKLQNFKLWYDYDNELGSYGRGVLPMATGVIDGTDAKKILFSFSGSPIALTPATAKYFFITADVAGSVNELTPAVQLSFNQDDLTFVGSRANAVEFGGTPYTFQRLNVTVATDMSPRSGYVTKDVTYESIFAFSLTPPANSPAFNFTGVTVKVNVNNSTDDDTDFTNFKLWIDNNKNGIYDAKDEQLGSAASRSNGNVTFAFTNAVVNSGNQYVMTCDVATLATSGKTIDAQIVSKNDMTLTNGAVADPDGPYSGNQLSVGNPGVATKLAIVSIEPDLRIPANSNLPSNVLVEGARFTVKVQAQDASGRPVKRAVSTNTTIYVSSGASIMYYDGTVINAGSAGVEMNGYSTIVFENVVLTNGNPGGELELVISALDVDGNLATGASETLTLRAKEPTVSLSNITSSDVTATAATLTWNNPLAENCILVMRALNAPSAPLDGYNYTAASANNFSTPSGSNGTTDLAGQSVVVYKGTDNTVDVGGLTPNTTYYATVYNFNGTDFDAAGTNGIMNFLATAVPVEAGIITSFKTAMSEPLSASNTLSFSNIQADRMTLNWVKPAGSSKSIVVARIGTAPAATLVDGVEYAASTVMGEESAAIGASYVVYSGLSNSVTVTNLAPNTSYYYEIYEFNGTGTATNYLATALSGNRSTLKLEPTAQATGINFSDMTLGSNSTIKVNWINGTGDGRIVLAKSGSAITESPRDYVDNYSTVGNSTTIAFGSTTAIGDAYVIYAGSNRNYVTLSGLTYGQTYYFRVFEYNGDGAATATTSVVNYITSEATGNPNSREADSYEINNALAQAKEITADGNYYTGIISSASDLDWLYFTPDVANGYSNIRLRLIDMPYNYTVELYNADGRLLRRSKRTGTQNEITVINNVPAGDYYIKIYSADGNYSLTPYRVNATTSKSEYKSNTP